MIYIFTDVHCKKYLQREDQSDTNILEASFASMHLSEEGEKELDDTIDYEVDEYTNSLSAFDDQLSDIDGSIDGVNNEFTEDANCYDVDDADVSGRSDLGDSESEEEDVEVFQILVCISCQKSLCFKKVKVY